MVSNVRSHMKINLESFSPLEGLQPSSCSHLFMALVQDWLLARATRSSPPLPNEDLSSSFPVQSKQAIASAAASSSSNRTPPRVRGSSSAIASAAAAAIGIEPFPLISLMRTLRRRDDDWSPEVCLSSMQPHKISSLFSHYTQQISQLLGSLPLDKPPSQKDRKLLVDALVEAFPEASKRMATVTRVCKQQVTFFMRKYQLKYCCVFLIRNIAQRSFQPKFQSRFPANKQFFWLLFTHVVLQARMGISPSQLCSLIKCEWSHPCIHTSYCLSFVAAFSSSYNIMHLQANLWTGRVGGAGRRFLGRMQ